MPFPAHAAAAGLLKSGPGVSGWSPLQLSPAPSVWTSMITSPGIPADGQPLTTWQDLSGAARHYAVAVPTQNLPTKVTRATYAAAQFAQGSSQTMRNAATLSTTVGVTGFMAVVLELNANPSGTSAVFHQNNFLCADEAGYFGLFAATVSTVPGVFAGIYDGTAKARHIPCALGERHLILMWLTSGNVLQSRKNGVAQVDFTGVGAPQILTNVMRLGGYLNTTIPFFNGWIHEVVTVPGNISAGDITLLESYLMTKWGIAGGTAPLWTPAEFPSVSLWTSANRSPGLPANGIAVTEWQDLSGNPNRRFALEGVGVPLPTKVVRNTFPAIQFVQTNTQMMGSTAVNQDTLGPNGLVWAVVEMNGNPSSTIATPYHSGNEIFLDGAGWWGICCATIGGVSRFQGGMTDGTSAKQINVNAPATVRHIVLLWRDTTSGAIHMSVDGVEGAQIVSGTPGGALANIKVGHVVPASVPPTFPYFNGWIYEVGMALSHGAVADRQKLIDFLSIEWAVTLGAAVPPAAVNDSFPSIEEGSGSHLFHVLENDTYQGIPTIAIQSVTGPAGAVATVSGTSVSSRIQLTTPLGSTGTKTVTYRLTHTAQGSFSDATMTVVITALPVIPVANNDTRNLLATETTVDVNVLANDTNVAGATVTIPPDIPGSVVGVTASVVSNQVRITRIGSGSGSYTLPYRATTTGGSDDAVLSGTIAALALPNPIAQWNLDASSGTAVADAMGTFPGVLVGTPSWQPSSGRIAGCLRFDGTTHYVTVANADSLFAPGRTITFWFLADALSVDRKTILSKSQVVSPFNGILISLNSATLEVFVDGGGAASVIVPDFAEIDQWVHGAIIFGADSVVRVYKNGTFVTSDNYSSMTVAGHPMEFGRQNTLGRFFDGFMDDIRVYNLELTSAQITTIVNQGGGVPAALPPVANNDTRDILTGQTTVNVNVLTNDLHVADAVVTIQGAVTGATAAVLGDQTINVTRIGTTAGSYSLTYRATTSAGLAQATLTGAVEAQAAAPVANNDTRNIAAGEDTVNVDVLSNDTNTSGASVTIQGAVSGATANVVGTTINVSRVGTSAGNYSLTYQAATPAGSDTAVLSGTIAAASGGAVGPIEAVNTGLPAADRQTITVASTPRQAWYGFGFGLADPSGSVTMHPHIVNNATLLYDNLNTTVLRINTADLQYKNAVVFGVGRGVDMVIATGYVTRHGITPTTWANQIKTAVDNGIPITHTCIQNEPDGHVDNAYSSTLFRSYAIELRNRLNAIGLSSIKIFGPNEWAHLGAVSGQQEYDLINAAPSLIPNTIFAGGGHCYRDCSTPQLWDDRWMTKMGATFQGLLSPETGNSGMPHRAARFLAGLNHGVSVECQHYAVTVHPTLNQPGDEPWQQSLISIDGTKRPWYASCQIYSNALTRGSRFRLCTCTDRPPGLNTTYADLMLRVAGNFALPRVNASAAKRPDGKWVILAVNTTSGAGAVNQFVHACYPAATMQLTVNIAELGSTDLVFTAQRSNVNGTLSSTTYNMQNGQTRFTLASGDAIALVSQ